jgi:precorrin-2 dehydrogenase/sirohydrochlorin ferrochelatase
MLPLILNASVKVGLAGAGEGLARRRALLEEAGVAPVAVSGELPPLQVLFVAGMDRDEAAALAARARALGILVNVEDVPELCDFHVPAIVRRGDLLLTASTGGRAPGLARRLREWLAAHFAPEWDAHLNDLGAARETWRSEGLSPDQVSQHTRAMVEDREWLS